MKRRDLIVGAELYYDTSRKWESRTSGRKAIVLAVEPHEMPQYTGSASTPTPHRVATGPGVLVDIVGRNTRGDYRRRDVVPLAHLRGPYAEVQQRVTELSAQRREQAEKHAQELRGQYVDAAAERPRTVGTVPPQNCVFCDIVGDRAPAAVVREWPTAIAIRPQNPVTTGHVLVLPREHVTDVATSPTVSACTMAAAAELAAELPAANIITSRGAAATQTVLHLHLHVIPRHAGDDLPLPWTPQQAAGED